MKQTFADEIKSIMRAASVQTPSTEKSKGGEVDGAVGRAVIRSTNYSMREVEQSFVKKMVLITAEEVVCEALNWVIPGWLPEGQLTLVTGDGRAGKSSMLYSIMSDLSQGYQCLGLSYEKPARGASLLIGFEDDIKSKVKPFLLARDADMTRISFHENTVDKEGKTTDFSLFDIEPIQDAILRSNAKLVIIDPASAFLPSYVDDNKDADVRTVLGPLAQMARELKIAIVLVKHTGKSNGKKASSAHLGSAAWRNACRAAWLVLRDEQTEDERVMFDVGSSSTTDNSPIRYAIKSAEQSKLNALRHDRHLERLSDEDREKLLGQIYEIEFLGETDADPQEMLNASFTLQRKQTSKDCAAWLRVRLGRSFAWRVDAIQAEVLKLGFSRRQFTSAKAILTSEGLNSKPRIQHGPFFMAFGDPQRLPIGDEIPE